jgi:hypothetical protein
MAVGCIVEFQGGTKEQYDRTREIVERDKPETDMPTGIIGHVAGALDNGNWCVINLWDSREGFQKFYDTRVKPAIAEVGLGQHQIRFFDVYNMFLKEEHQQETMRKAA